jgi:hypothetical protein
MTITERAVERLTTEVVRDGDCLRYIGTHDSHGYGIVHVRADGKQKIIKAHRAAWIAANGDIPDGICVCHKCDVRDCIKLDHLFLGSNADNQRDKFLKGRQPKGTEIHRAKLNNDSVLEIRRLLSEGRQQKEIANQFGVSQSAIWGVKTNTTWRCVRGGL